MEPTTENLIQGAAGSGDEKVYVEDVFSTEVYTGTGATHSIDNGIDLDGEGGMVWIKSRTNPGTGAYHHLVDSERAKIGGFRPALYSNTAEEQNTYTAATYGGVSSLNSDGFTISSGSAADDFLNSSTYDYAAWTFRKAPGFFDVVTYNGDTSSTKEVSHNLGCIPGMILVKNYTTAGYSWAVYAKNGQTGTYNARLLLNSTDGRDNLTTTDWSTNSAQFTKDVFTVGSGDLTNMNGQSHVAYLFADGADADAQIFGDNGDEAIIKCGTFGGTGTLTNVGFEPQWLLVKRINTHGDDWHIYDNMRGMALPKADNGGAQYLKANATDAEAGGYSVSFESNGFYNNTWGGSSGDLIYIAIRRPNKSPKAGTEVFNAISRGGSGSTVTLDSNMGPVDMFLIKSLGDSTANVLGTRMLGPRALTTSSTAEENTNAFGTSNPWDVQEGINLTSDGDTNASFRTFIDYFFRRAPGFFDTVCYDGTGVARTQEHNLGVVPELIIVKTRNVASQHWWVYNKTIGEGKALKFNGDNAEDPWSGYWNDTAPTSSVFSLDTYDGNNGSGKTYVAYLFASLGGVSKVGTYSGTGNDIDVDCGFTGGARFVLVKRTDAAGDWYVWDTVRGIVSGDDPYLLLNSTAAQVTNTDYIDPLSTGFTVTSSAPDALNVGGGTYIYLAIA